MATAGRTELLDLPVELLQNITDNLSDESVMQLRRTCKTLDNATIDRFASHHFKDYHCCIFHEHRWDQLINLLRSSRLADRICHVTLTTNTLEGIDLEDIQLARAYCFEDLARAQFAAFCVLNQSIHQLPVITSLVKNVVLELKMRERQISIQLDLTCHAGMKIEEATIVADLLSAVALSGLQLHELKLSCKSTIGLEALLEFFKPSLALCASTLIDFEMDAWEKLEEAPPFDDNRLDFVAGILKSARRLRRFEISLDCFFGKHHIAAHTEALLSACRFSKLQVLHLNFIRINESHMLSALSRIPASRSLDLLLEDVELVTETTGWRTIWQQLLLKPNIHILKLGYLVTESHSYRILKFENMEHGEGEEDEEGDITTVTFKGVENVTAGLRELLAKSQLELGQ